MSGKKSRKVRMGSSRQPRQNQDEHETNKDDDGSQMLSKERKVLEVGADSVSVILQTDLVSSDNLSTITQQHTEGNNPPLNDVTESNLSQPVNPYLLKSLDTAGKRRKMGSTRQNKRKPEETDFGVIQDTKTGDTEKSLEIQASIAVVESESHSNREECLGQKESEMNTESRSQREFLLITSNTLDQPDDRCKEEVGEDIEPSSEAVVSYSSELLQDTLGSKSLLHLPLDLALQVVHGFAAEPITEELKKEEERRQESEHAEVESFTFLSSRHSLDQSLESDTLTNTEEFESFNNTIILQSGEGEEKLEPVVNESELQDDINSTGPGSQETLHQRDEDENFVDLIVEENIVLANITHFRQPDHVESYQPERSEDITCFLQSTPSDSSLGHDKSAQSESRRRKMGSTRRNPRGRHEEEEHGESKMHRYRYLQNEGEEVILGKEEIFGIKEAEFEISMEPKDSTSVDEKEGEQMEKENFQTEKDTENIEETGRRLEWDMGTVEGSGVETSEESLVLLEPEHGADEEKKGMEEESLIEPTPFDQYIDSVGIADQLYNQEKGNRFTVDSVNTETESNNEASMAHIVDPIEPFSVGLDQSGDTLLREEEVSDFTLLVNHSEVSKSSQIAYDCALTLESDDTFSTDPKISPSQLIQTPCMEITNPFLNPLLPQSIQGNEEDANTDPNTTGGLDTSEVILLSEEEMSDHVPLGNEVSVSSQMTYDDKTLTTEPCQTDEALSTDPNISASQLNQTPYSDDSHNSFPNSLLLQSVQDQGDNAANTDSNQSPSPSRRRKMGSTRRHPRGVQREEEGTEEKQEGEIESTEEIEDKRENMDAVEGSCMEFEMLMESKDGAGNEKNEGEERNEESVLTDLSCSFSTSNQEGRNIEADIIESESQSIIKESMATKLLLPREAELTQISQTLHNPYPDVPTIESYDSYLTDDTLNSNPAITGLQHKETSLEETLDESRGNTDSPPDPPSLQSSLGPEETAEVESYTPGRKRKIGSTRSKTRRGRKGEERREEGQEEEKGEGTDVIGEVGDVIITAEMDSSIEKSELVELEELLEKVTEEQAMADPEIVVVEGEVNIVLEGESGIEKSELVEHTEKVREAEEIEVEVKIVAESESNQTPSDTAALTVEAQESGDMVCIEPYITSQYMEDNNPSLNDLTELNLSQTENPYLLESPDTAKKRRKRGSTRRNKGKQAETDFGENQDSKTGDAEKSLQLQESIAVVESWSYSNTEELLGPKESETEDTECSSQSEFLLFASNTLNQPDDRCKEEVGEDIEPSSEAVVSYSSELLQDTLGTKSLLHLPLDLALQVVHGVAAEPITEELKKEEERRQESEHAEVESSTFLSSRHSLDQSLESDTLTNTEEFESFNNTIILQSGEGEEKLEPVVNESELQDDINSTGPGSQETLHQRDEDENFVDLIVEENIVLANITHFRQPDHVESYQPEQSEDITCFLQSTPSDSSLGHDKSAQSESRRRKMGSIRRNPRGRHEEEEHGESKMHRYRYLENEGEEVILGKEEMFGIKEAEFEISMEPKDSTSVDEKEGEQMEKENFQTEKDTENIEETGRRLEWDMGTVEGSGVETSEESLVLLEPEHGADEEKKGMEEESLIEPTPFDQYIDSVGIADQLYNQEKGNRFTVDSVNTETESNNEASMAHIVDPIEPFSVGLDQSGDTLLREEEVSDFTLLVNHSEVSKSSQIAYDCALTLESDDTFSTDPKISPSPLILTPCMEITNPFLNPLLPQSIQGNEEDANTDPNTTGGLDTSEVILLSEEEMSDHVPLGNEVSVSSQMTYDDKTLTTEPCQTDEALSTDPNISASQLNQTPYSDDSHNSFPNSLLLQSVQDQGDNAANTDSNQSPSPSRRRKMGSTRRHPRGVQREEEGTEEKQEGEIESTEEIEDKRENMDAVEGSCMEFEMLMESKDGAGNEKNEGEERNEESVLTDLSCSFSTSNQEGRNIEADIVESESQSIIKESMATKLLLPREAELTQISQTLHNPYPDVPTIESYDSYLTDDTLNSNPAITGLQHKETSLEETLDESRGNTDSPPDPPSLQSSLGPEETAEVESYTPGRKRKIGSTRSKTRRGRKGEERREEGQEEEKGEGTDVIGEVGDVIITAEMDSSIEKSELVELEELLEKVTEEQAMADPEIVVVEGEVNIVLEGESGIEKSELVEHTEKVREAEEIEVEVKIVAESESNQTPSDTAALTVEAQESGDMVCIEPYITSQYMEDNNPSLNDLTELNLSQTENPYLLESPDTAKKRRKRGSTRRNKGKQAETDFGENQDSKTGDAEKSLQLQESIAVVESWSYSNTEELLGPKESETEDTECSSQSEFLLFASNTLNQPDDRCKEEVGEDIEPSSEAVVSYSSELLQDTLGTKSLLHLPLDLALQVVHGVAAEPITEELKKEEERRQESEHAEVESSTFLSSRHSLDQSLESDTLTNTEEFESFNNTIILQSGEGEEKLEPVVNESELQDDINSTGPGSQETLHQRDEDENFVDLIVEENIVLANITHFRQPDHVESYQPEQSEDITCFLQSTPSDSSLGHDKSAQSESRRRKMGSTRRNPRGRHEEEEHGESKMHRYRYLENEGEEVILGKEEMFGIKEAEFEISMEPKDSTSVDEKEGEQMEKENFQTEKDTENIEETGRRLEWDMGTVEGSGVETSEESLVLLEPEHGADEEKKGMEEESLIEPTPFDQYVDSVGIADQLYNQEKGNRFTVDSVNTETESNNEASMAHIVDPIEPFSVGLDQSGDTLLREEEVSDFTLLVNHSEVSKSSQIAYDCALTLESDDTFSTDPKISPSPLILTPCMEITNPFLNPLLPQSIQGNEEDANTDPNTTGGLDTSEVILLSEEEMSDHVPLGNEVSVSSQMTYDDKTLTTEPCQTDEALSTDPNISASQLNQTPYSDDSHNSFPNSLLLQSVQDQGDNAANTDSNQSPSPSRRRKMGSTRRHPRGVQREEEGTEEKQEGEIESTEEIEDKRENMDAVEGSCMEFEMLMESKDGAGNEKNEGEERNEESVLTDLSCSFSTSNQEGRNIEADIVESESQSIIKESMATKLLLPREAELTQISQTLHNPYPDVPTIESYDSYLTDDTLNSNPAITGLQHKETSLEETLDESRGNTDSPPDPPSLQSSLGPEETAEVESYTPGRKRKIGSTRSKTRRGRKGEERREEGQEEEKGEGTDVIGEVGDVIITAEMDSSIEKSELVELEELLEKVTEEQAMADPEIVVVEGEVNIVLEGESGIEKSELVEHTEKVREAEEIEVEVKIVAESESNQTPSDTAALTVEAQESGDMVCIEPYITSQYMEDNNPSLNDLTELNLSQTENPYLLESPDTAKKRRKRGSTRRNKGKQAETDFGENQDSKTGDAEKSLQLQESIAVVESWSYSNTEELLGPKESETEDTECSSQSEFLLFASNTLNQPDDRCKEEVGEDIEPSSEAVVSYSSELLQDTLGTKSLLHLPLDLALQVVHGVAAEPITEELKKEEERRQESEHAEVESSTFLSSRHSLDQSLESDTLTNTEEFESFNNTIILQSGEGEEKLEPVVNESELQDDINSTGPGSQETLHQRDEDENFVDLIVEENIVLANITHFRQPDHVESYQPEQNEDITCFLQSTPSDSSLGHDKSAQSESRRRKMGSTRRNPRGRHEEEEHGESKMHRYRYLENEGEEVILGKEEMFGIKEAEFEISMEPKDSTSVDEKEGEQMEKENFQTEKDTENIEETGRRLEWDMGTVEGSGVETSEESLVLLEPEHGADEEKKGMEEESLIEPTPFDQYVDSVGIADQLYNQEKGNRFTVDSVNTETESNNEASMAHIVDPIEPFSVGLDQSGDTLLREEEVSDFTLLVNHSEVSKSSQIAYDCALTLESDDTFSTDPKISPSPLILTPCMEITNPFLNPLLPQSIQGNEEDANTDPNTTGGLDTSEVILLSEEEMSDHVPLGNEVSVSSQMTYDDKTLTTEPCQTDEALSTDPNISASQLNQTPYSDDSHNSFPNSLLLQSVQDQGDNAANTDSNQSPSPSRRRKMGSTRRHPRGVQREEEGTEEKQEGEIESTEEIEDKRENMDAVEGSCMEFEMLMESKDGAGNEKNEGEERNEESVLTDLSCSFSTSNQEGRNIEADIVESESQSIIKESMATKLLLPREAELTQISQTLHNPYPDVPTIESYDSYLTDDTLNSNPAITGLQHKETSLEETLDESRGNTDSPPDPPSLQSSLGPEETAEVESYTPGRKRKIGSTRSKTRRGRKGEERREEGQEEEKGEGTDVIGEVGDVIITAEMDSSIEKSELVELEELLEKVTEEQAMADPEIVVVEGEVNIVLEGESGIEKSELVEHTEKVREAEEIEVEVKIVAESESNQTPSDTAALTVEAQESGDMVCIEPYITSQYMEDNNPSLNDLTELNLSQTENPYLLESPDTAKKRRKRGSTRRNKGKQAETDFGENQDSKTGDAEKSLQLQESIAVVESWSYSNTEELLGPKESETEDTECSSQSEFLLFASNTLNQPDDRCKEEVGEDIEPSSEAVVSYSSELLQDTLGTKSLLHLPLDLALQVVHGVAAEPITEELKKEEERRQESEHAEVESSTFLSSRHSLDQSLESDTLTNTEEFESFNNTIILQSGEGEEKLEPVVNESELQDDINSTGPGSQETLHQRDEDENFVDLIVEENIVLANITHFRQPDHVESYQPEQNEDITCFLQSTPSDSSLGHDKSAQSESRRRKMGSTRRNPRGRHEEEEHGESKMHRYRYLENEGEEVILGKEEMFGIKEAEFEISMEPKDSTSVDEKEGEQMEKENFQTEKDTENIEETGRRLEWDMGTVEGSGVETSEESLVLLEPEHGADEEKKGMEEESLIEPTPFDQYVDSVGIADQLYNQEKGNRFTVDSVNTETESNNEASMAHIVDPIEPFSVGLDQSGDTLLREEEVSDFTLLVNHSEVSKSSQIAYDCALTLESDDTFSTDPKISPSPLILTPCMEITNPFLNPLLPQSIQGNEEDANTDPNTTGGLDTSEVILLSEEEMSDHVPLGNEVSVSSQMTYDDKTLTTEPCQTDEALSTDPNISASQLNQTPYSDDSHNSFPNSLLLQSVQDQGDNAANTDSNQSPSPSRRRKMGSTRRHPRGVQREEEGTEEKQEGEIESTEEIEDKRENMDAVEGSCMEFEMLMESKDGAGNEKNEGEERNEESVLTDLSCSFSTSNQEGRNIEADIVESESQSIIKESMATKLLLPREAELTQISQTLHNPYPDVPTIESYDSYLTDDTLNSNPAITGLQHKETSLEETLDESRGNTDSPPDPPSLQSSLGPEETAEVESYTPGRKRKIGSTRSKTRRGRKGEERREEGQEEEKGEGTDVIGEVGDVIITAEMDSSIEKSELVELEELLEKVTEEQAMADPEIVVVEGEVNIVLEGESGIEKSELVEHTEKVREAEEIEVEVKIVAESESNQTPSDTAALTVEAQESGDMVCIEPYITSQYMEDNNPSLNDLTELNLSQTENPYLLESPDTAKKRRKRGSTRRNKGKQAETDFGENQDSKTGDAEKSLQLQESIAVVESWSYSNTEELLGPKESETEDTECSSQSEFLLFASNTLNQPDDRCKEEVGEDIEPSSEAVVSYSSELLQDTLGTKSLLHLPLDLALQVVHGVAAEPITEELKKEEERRQESEHAEVESSTFLSSRHSLDQSLESDTLTNTEEFESFNNTIILQSGEGEEKLEPVVNESELQDDINSTGPGSQETLHQRDEDENFVDLIVEENIVLANITHFRQPDHVESYQPEQNEDITCFLQSTPSDSSLGHDKSAQSESRRRKMGSTRRNPRGRHEEEEHGESKMHRYRYLENEGEEVILGKEEMFGIKEAEFEISMEPKDSTSVDEKEGEQMEKENFQTEKDTENIEETGRRLEWDMGTVEGSGVETSEESLVLLEPEHGADEEKKGMEEESLIEPTPFDQYVDSVGIADQLYNQEKGNRFTVDSVNTETESNNEASMAHIVDPIEPFSVGLDQSGDTLLREEEVSDFTLLVNHSEVSKSSQIAYDCALTLESDDTFSTDPKISPSPLILTPCMEITNPFLNPLLPQSIQGNEEDANTDPNTTGGLDTSEVILLSEEEMSDHVPLGNEVSVSSQMTYDDKTLTTEPCQTDEALSTDPNISASQLNQTPYSDDSHNSFPNSLLLQSVQDQGDNAANTDSNQSPSPSRRRKMGSTRRHPRGVQREEEGTEEKQEGEIESTEEIEDKRENMDAVEGSCMEFEMLMESKDGAGNEKNEGEERNEESVLTDLSCSFSTSNQEGRNIEADIVESESQSIIKESMATKLLLPREAELTQISQTLHNPYPDVPTIESYDSYLTDDTLNSNPAITGLQHKETSLEETLDESRGNTDSPPDPPSLQSSLGPEETAEVESYTPGRKRKIGSTRSKTRRGRKGEERREEGQEEEKGEGTDVIGEVGDVIITAEMDSSIEKSELVELEELLEKVTEEQAMADPEIVVVEGEVNIVLEGESGIEKSELVEHTEKVREAEEIEVEVKIVAESESNQTPSDTAALTVEAQESGYMVCIDPHISAIQLTQTADMEQCLLTPSNSPSLPSKSSLSLSSQSHEDVGESKATGKRRKMGSTHRTQGGLHAEEEKQETGENITEAEVRAETIGNPEVNADLERFEEERRAEAVSLEDQQEIQSTEKETILIEVVASSTVLSGKASEPVAPAPQPRPGNKRGQEKAERVEKPPGTFGSSGSSSNPYNVVMVGNSSVGKTSFMRRFQSGEFCLHHDATIGIDTCIQSVTVDASPVTLQLWDTAGQERFHSITRQVFHKAQGLLLMYDITSSQSFCDICYWVNCIQEGAPDDVIVILLGNKTDCAELEREVQTHEGENLAKGYDMLFMECSAATGDNVTLSMETLARMLKQLGEQTKQEEGSLVLQKEPPKKKSGCC